MRITTTYWMTNPDWYDYDENEEPYLTDTAPPEAHKSFELCRQKLKKSVKDNILYD